MEGKKRVYLQVVIYNPCRFMYILEKDLMLSLSQS